MMQKILEDILKESFLSILIKKFNIFENNLAVIEIDKEKANDLKKTKHKINTKENQVCQEKLNKEGIIDKKDKEKDENIEEDKDSIFSNKNKENESSLIIKIKVLSNKIEIQNKKANELIEPQKAKSLKSSDITVIEKLYCQYKIFDEEITLEDNNKESEVSNKSNKKKRKNINKFPKNSIISFKEKYFLGISTDIQKFYIYTPSPEDSLKDFKKDFDGILP